MEGPVDADELGQALKEARCLRVLVLNGASLSRSAAEQIAGAVAGKAQLRLLYMAHTGISQARTSMDSCMHNSFVDVAVCAV